MKTSITLGTVGFLLLGMTAAHANPNDILIYDDVGDKPTYLISVSDVAGQGEKILTATCDQYVDASTIKTKCQDPLAVMNVADFNGFVKKIVAEWAENHPNQGLIPLSAKTVTAFAANERIKDSAPSAAANTASITQIQSDLTAAKNLLQQNPTSPKYIKRVSDLQGQISQINNNAQAASQIGADAVIANTEIETHANEILALFRHTEKPVTAYGSKIKNQLIEAVVGGLLSASNSPSAMIRGTEYSFTNQNGTLIATASNTKAITTISQNIVDKPIATSSGKQVFVLVNMANLIGIFRYDDVIAAKSTGAFDYNNYFSFITPKEFDYKKLVSMGYDNGNLIIRLKNQTNEMVEATIDTSNMVYDMRNFVQWKAVQ
jgi:hypothetical protein